jgi:hypothetical protein
MRRWQPPRERLEEMFSQAVPDSPELRRLQVAAMTGGDADLHTAEEA